MTQQEQKQWLGEISEAAELARHPFPEYAACEAALESDYGQTGLATADKNLFGCKQHWHPVYGTVWLPTREFLSGQWVTVDAAFVRYPNFQACFQDRLQTLERLAPRYPHYRAALAAKTGEEFVTEVSKTWSTDPLRSEKVLKIYHDFYGQS